MSRTTNCFVLNHTSTACGSNKHTHWHTKITGTTGGGGPGRPPFWRTPKESYKGLGSVSLKLNTQHTRDRIAKNCLSGFEYCEKLSFRCLEVDLNPLKRPPSPRRMCNQMVNIELTNNDIK